MIISGMDRDVSVHFEGTCRLHDWGVIRAQGEDAAKFLHGQLSNDFEKLPPGQARLAAYCTAQGRMLASVIGSKHAADEVWLACSADLLPATLKRLSMFVLRAKARLSDASAELAVLGWVGDSARSRLGDSFPAAAWQACTLDEAEVIRLPDAAGQARLLWIGPVAAAAGLQQGLPALPEAHWQWLEVMSGVARVNAATSGQFVPQMLNYELVGGVDFKKGCYPGQEIVARSQYLGKLKRRSFLLHAEVALQSGQEVYWSGDEAQPAGMVALACAHPEAGFDAIVELKSAVLGSGSLHLGAPRGPLLQPRPLPYALPAETAAA